MFEYHTYVKGCTRKMIAHNIMESRFWKSKEIRVTHNNFLFFHCNKLPWQYIWKNITCFVQLEADLNSNGKQLGGGILNP